MGTENIQHRFAQFFGILRQMEKFVGTTQAHRDRSVSQVLNGVFQLFLSLALLNL